MVYDLVALGFPAVVDLRPAEPKKVEAPAEDILPVQASAEE